MTCSSYRFLDRTPLSLLSQHHSTALPSPNRYEGKVMKQSPRSFPSPRWLVGTEPQRDVRRLHSFPYYIHQVFIEGFQVRLVLQLGGECFQGLSSVVLPAVEATVYERLDAATERGEQSCDQEGECNDREGGLLTREQDEDSLQHDDATEVECNQHGRQRTVYKGTVYDLVNVVEAVPQDGDAYGHRQTRKANHSEYEADLPQPRRASRL